ncbi:MAG: asparagine synthase (glutamine-hydrolyzing) [Flavobacteriia bacterium]|nr:asparagine synthase (glutamine-hydrolyzing) [Flavobacteriia bacterium]
MCGIIGACWKNDEISEKQIEKALSQIKFRGPDDDGIEYFQESEFKVFLGHTRLSIIDLSSSGHQPYFSPCKKYVMSYNGEIYNYLELKKELQNIGIHFYSNTDTEVLLQAYIYWGELCLKRFQGMFAFVIYDLMKQSLFCARDAFGIKPFYYSIENKQFQFSSDVKSINILLNKKNEANLQTCFQYLKYGLYDHSEETFYKNIKRLKSGHFLEFDIQKNTITKYENWWKPDFSKEIQVSFKDAVEQVRTNFLHNISLHLRSDVKIGAALSGGIDSSAIVCAIKYLHKDFPLETFSYLDINPVYNEKKWVEIVNKQCNFKNFQVSFTEESFIKEIDEMLIAQGEPFGSTSIFAQYKIMKKAKEQGIKVMLEGQGADELLAGYNGFVGQRLLSLWETHSYFEFYSFAKSWSDFSNKSIKDALFQFIKLKSPNYLIQFLRSKSMEKDTKWLNGFFIEQNAIDLLFYKPKLKKEYKSRRVIEQLLYSSQQNGLPHLLRHSDRNSMNFQIEARVPFLTTSFAETLLSLPENYLISSNGVNKFVFREAIKEFVPKEIVERKDKIGFVSSDKEIILANKHYFKQILKSAESIPFFNVNELLKEFDLIVENKKKYTWQVWRWINFIRWVQLNDIQF